MIFVESNVFTHARYWQIKKYVCMIFLCVGGTWGAPIICGGGARAPQAPPPVATPLCTVGQGEAKTAQNSIWLTAMSKLLLKSPFVCRNAEISFIGLVIAITK